MLILVSQVWLTWFALVSFLVCFMLFLTIHTLNGFAIPSLAFGFSLLGGVLLLESAAYEEIPLRSEFYSQETSSSQEVPSWATAISYDEPTPQATVSRQSVPAPQPIVSNQNGLTSQASVTGQKRPTNEARKLSDALNGRGIQNKMEFDDGYKHIDIYIPSVRLCIEVDGEKHSRDTEQWFNDLERDLHSWNDGRSTIRIPNYYVDNYLNAVADTIAKIINEKGPA